MQRNVFNDLLHQPKSLAATKQTANQLPLAVLVRSLLEIEPHKRGLAFRLLEKDKAINVFEALTYDQQASLLQGIADPEVLPVSQSLQRESSEEIVYSLLNAPDG
ncbi:magnesium transporter MgtE N-terminal domain-containing protein [Chroogloeocystis siderophila]|uniref:Magnesium transporter MgtE intracellular domain-containing protein n=1 Tax=Chroogloeocystis siderophila 5.2 s.c.1 TaxID=247279 RepID=A0A1U7HYH8_9CHRO|nr:hypothetical protein [Chroogloeocystis siderophila]OKH28682.1 hypothetical protein NIES1031_01840 [Chroogloeocystis siderophila 5.2 s.c.1]